MKHENWRNYPRAKESMRDSFLLDPKFERMAGESDKDADLRWQREEWPIWYKLFYRGEWYIMRNRRVVREIWKDEQGRDWVAYERAIKCIEFDPTAKGEPETGAATERTYGRRKKDWAEDRL